MADERSTSSKVAIFISHSTEDRELAGAVVRMLKDSLEISDEVIRCTSVEAHKLPPGAKSRDALRTEIIGCKVVIGILTHASRKADWVLFELGAAWGRDVDIVPLLHGDLDFGDLPPPIHDSNAIKLDDRSGLHRLVEHIERNCGLRRRSRAGSAEAIEKVIQIANSVTQTKVLSPRIVTDVGSANDNREYLVLQMFSSDHGQVISDADVARALTVDRLAAEVLLEDLSRRALLRDMGGVSGDGSLYTLGPAGRAKLVELRSRAPRDVAEGQIEILRTMAGPIANEWTVGHLAGVADLSPAACGREMEQLLRDGLVYQMTVESDDSEASYSITEAGRHRLRLQERT